MSQSRLCRENCRVDCELPTNGTGRFWRACILYSLLSHLSLPPHAYLSSCLSVLLSLACDRMSESLPISVSCSRIYLIPIFSLSVSSYVAAVVLCACLLSLHVSLDVCFSARLKIVSRIISRSSASCILPSLGSCIYPSSARQKPQTLQRHQIVYCTSERSWHDSRRARHQLAYRRTSDGSCPTHVLLHCRSIEGLNIVFIM